VDGNIIPSLIALTLLAAAALGLRRQARPGLAAIRLRR
jgi:hypothetical protein